METTEHIRTLEEEGRALVSAVDETGTDAEVPTCPGWRVRDLVRHTGTVHRWATAFVAEGYTAPRRMEQEPDLDGAALLAWFEKGHRRLVDTLRAAPADTDCWAFLPAPSPVAFWARRQAHETAVHRIDAESARGTTPGPIPAAFAVDGIDELLLGFQAREKSRVRTETPRVLRVRATDTDTVWTVRLSAEPPVSERGETADADCEFTGTAERLYLSLWNRAPLPQVSGDRALADLWRERSGIV